MDTFLNLFRRHPDMDHSIQEMEAVLEGALVPVEPSLVFINDLRKSLFRRQIEQPAPSVWTILKNRLLLVGGVLGAIVMLISSIKAIVSILQIIAESIRGISKMRSKPKAAASG